MKISSASKKVLASALSAAMVVAFSPAVAMAATNTGGNAWYNEEEIGHNLDNGVITKAPTCTAEGVMTYTCKDGDGFAVTAPIAPTGKHSYSADTSVAHADKNGFVWTKSGSTYTAVFNYKCDGGEKAHVNATVETKTDAATFYAAGEVTYTATAKDAAGKTYTSAKSVATAQLSTDGLAVEKVDVSDPAAPRVTLKNSAGKTQVVVGSASSKAADVAEGATEANAYTAKIDLPTGVFFDAASSDVNKVTTTGATWDGTYATSSNSVAAADGKLVVKYTVEGENTSTAHKAATSGTVGTGADDVKITAANNATNTPETAADPAGVTIAYSGNSGTIADGTATTEAGYWTIEAKCSTHPSKSVAEKQFATKVTRSACSTGTYYTIEYAGGEYTLKTAAAAGVTGHGYVLDKTVWSHASGKYTATMTYKCACGHAYIVELSSDGSYKAAQDDTVSAAQTALGSAAAVSGKVTVENKGAAATCAAEGKVEYALTMKGAASNEQAIVDALGATPAATLSYSLPKRQDTFGATVDWVVASGKANVTVKCSNGEFKSAKTVDVTSEHVDAAMASDGNVTAGYTLYTAAVELPEGVTELDSTVAAGTVPDAGKYNVWDNGDGTYTAKYRVADKASAQFTGTLSEGLPSDKAGEWVVSDNGKSYVASAVAVKDVAHSKKAPKVQKSYTLTYNGDKTIVVNATGSEDAHVWALDHYKVTVYGTDSAGNQIVTKVVPVLTCECGETVEAAEVALSGSVTEKQEIVYGGKVVATANIGAYIASSHVYSKDPTFKWDGSEVTWGNTMPTCKATFVSSDGKMKVTVDCKVTLVDAATCTYKAEVQKADIPEGYNGNALTDTKVINIHENHAMVLTNVKKASASASGYAEYWCNVDGSKYLVTLAKDNMKVTPSKKTFKASAVKKSAKTVTVKVSDAKGKVSYKSSSKKVTVSKKGVVTVKKGTKKGTYKVTVTSKATQTYAKNVKTVKIVVK